MKKYFFTGLAFLLPIVLTLLILVFLLNLLTRPFEGLMLSLIDQMSLEKYPIIKQILAISTKIGVLIFLCGIIFAVGLLGRIFIINSLIKFGEKILHNIPMVNKVYKAAQDVVETLFVSEKTNFSDVVLVPFPHEDAMSVGFITDSSDTGTNKLSVFIPATPNPTMGFMLLFDRKDVHPLDITVEEALRIIVSCGAMLETFTLKKIDEAAS